MISGIQNLCALSFYQSLNVKLFFFMQRVKLMFQKDKPAHKPYIHHISNYCKLYHFIELDYQNAYLTCSNFLRSFCRKAFIALLLVVCPWLLLRVDSISGHMKNASSIVEKLLVQTCPLSSFLSFM